MSNRGIDEAGASNHPGREGQDAPPATVAGASVLLLAVAGLSTIGPEHAFGDASAPPNFPTNCPPAQFPPAGYFNPTPGQPTPPAGYSGPPYHGPIPYEVPFKAIIYGGQITLGGGNPNTPSVLVPHLFASICGTVTLPCLVGLVPASDINLATPNIYVGAGAPGTSSFNLARIRSAPCCRSTAGN